jgi:16S rRNA (guanine(527)-N(7))-methyltransferase RsmG
MFTSRAEYRILLRADNADERLTDKGIELGMVCDLRKRTWKKKKKALENATYELKRNLASPQMIKERGLKINQDGKKRSAFDMLGYNDSSWKMIEKIWPYFTKLGLTVVEKEQLRIKAFYQKYVNRQNLEIAELKKESNLKLLKEINLDECSGISNEIREIIRNKKPQNIAEASSLPGMTPTAVSLLLRYVKKKSMTFSNKSRAAFMNLYDVSRETMSMFDEYEKILKEWQKKFNLIGNSTINKIWSRHFLDSALAYKVLRSSLVEKNRKSFSLIDVGTGAGFPGLVIALLFVETKINCDIYLIESNKKKIKFLNAVIKSLNLKVTVINNRVENENGKYDYIVSRAFAPLEKLLRLIQNIYDKNATLILFKGKTWKNEVNIIKKNWNIGKLVVTNNNDLDKSEGVLLVMTSLIKKG